ncbi:hypothetical protein JCM19233_5946 [Vibrio astriarenae]|nr:hypothetical protein JCM19233_5946 [Vibrio sp. C7]
MPFHAWRGYHAGYRVNVSPSYPLGLYQVTAKAHYHEAI